jgi:hypothetical protein
MANIRATLDKAASERVLDSGTAVHLTEISKSLFYKERRWCTILRLADSARLRLPDFEAWLRGSLVDQKRIDALEMIAAIRAHLEAGVSPRTVPYKFRNTGYHIAATGYTPRQVV